MKRSAFTVIELLAATALAGLMLAAVSGVLGTLSRQHREIMSQQHREPWQRRLIDQLQWDFANARQYEVAPKQLTLVGNGGRDFATHVPIFCRAEIRYEVLELASRPCLVRREIHPEDRALCNSGTELVCFDIATIDVRSLEKVHGNRQTAPGSIPRTLRLKVARTSSALAAVDEVLHVY